MKRTQRFAVTVVVLVSAALLMPAMAGASFYDCFTFTKWSPRGNAKSSGTTYATGKVWYGSGFDVEGPKTVKVRFSNRRTKFYFTKGGDPAKASRVSRNKFFWYMRQKKYAPTNSRACSVRWHWVKHKDGKRHRQVDKIIGGIVGS